MRGGRRGTAQEAEHQQKEEEGSEEEGGGGNHQHDGEAGWVGPRRASLATALHQTLSPSVALLLL